jgi:ABC-2 type transport system ATP-binding protein
MKQAVTITKLYVRRSASFRLRIENFTAASGSITCISGPNGSGKSTLMECLVGLTLPTVGTVVVNGKDSRSSLRQIRASVGYIPDDEEWFIKELSAREYFDLLVDIYERAGIHHDLVAAWHELARRLMFTTFDTPIQDLSHGNKKKVQIIAALMQQPPVIVVDEIRNGLDPLAIKQAEHLLQEYATKGACIIATTHDLWWAERIADSVAILVNGSLRYHQDTQKMLGNYGSLENLFIELTRQ